MPIQVVNVKSGGGSSLTAQYKETPSGTVNGTNVTFTLTYTPNPALSLDLYTNGVLQIAGTAFTLSGGTITYASGHIPQTGDIIICNYTH